MHSGSLVECTTLGASPSMVETVGGLSFAEWVEYLWPAGALLAIVAACWLLGFVAGVKWERDAWRDDD